MASLYLTASLLAHTSSAFLSPPLPTQRLNQPIPSLQRQPTNLFSHDTARHLSTLPLPQLLELLRQNNLRYAPNATREELEDLLHSHLYSTSRRRGGREVVMDVQVIHPPMDKSRRKRERPPSNRPKSKRASRRDSRPRYQHRNSNDIIDVEFDLPESPNDTYDNGLQIFLMGFLEAGKTAAELALDAAKQRTGFSDEDVDCDRGAYWYDERPRRRRRGRERYTTRPRADQSGADYGYRRNQYDVRPPEVNTLHTRQKPISRSRIPTSNDGEPKPLYGIEYARDVESEGHFHKRQWKDRLRKKFDAALGLESTMTPTEKESYYESWKRNMGEMDDSHKDRLRRRMKEDTESLEQEEQPAARSTSAMNSERVPQNRRARMRAAKNGVLNEPSPPVTTNITAISPLPKIPSKKKYNSSKLRTKETPFWKERGSIASLLFDNSASSWKKSMQKKNKNTLEQLLLSPTGRERTITSLILYIFRSGLSVFGNLCRWAGVRGTIPQPIVVVTVCAVILSSHRHQVVLSLGLTLLAIRMIGEFIHGGVHGNEFWDDEYDAKMHEWVAEDDADDGSLQRSEY